MVLVLSLCAPVAHIESIAYTREKCKPHGEMLLPGIAIKLIGIVTFYLTLGYLTISIGFRGIATGYLTFPPRFVGNTERPYSRAHDESRSGDLIDVARARRDFGR